MSENVLTIENATMQFGGVVAVDNLILKVDKDQIVCPHRPQRCRQDHRVQLSSPACMRPPTARCGSRDARSSENTPHGKMKKLYTGQNASKYSHMIAPTPDKITQMGIARTFQNIRLLEEPDRV